MGILTTILLAVTLWTDSVLFDAYQREDMSVWKEYVSSNPSPLTSNPSPLYIGDSLVDRETARNAGVPFIACSWGFVPREKLIEAGITTIVDRAEEILTKL